MNRRVLGTILLLTLQYTTPSAQSCSDRYAALVAQQKAVQDEIAVLRTKASYVSNAKYDKLVADAQAIAQAMATFNVAQCVVSTPIPTPSPVVPYTAVTDRN